MGRGQSKRVPGLRVVGLTAEDDSEKDLRVFPLRSAAKPLRAHLGLEIDRPTLNQIRLEAAMLDTSMNALVKSWIEPHLERLRNRGPRAA
jgi:hypothetical protein